MQILPKEKYSLAANQLKSVDINTLFARSVLENRVGGLVYTDNEENPLTYYVVHPYKMSLLFGNSNNDEFNENFKKYALNINKTRANIEWMQTFPANWDATLKDLLGNKLVKAENKIDNLEIGNVEVNSRINFKFNIEKYDKLKRQLLTNTYKIVSTSADMFSEMKGSVIPLYFWRNAEQFVTIGKGFSVIIDNYPIATAYSAFIHDNYLEIGIETVEEYRGKGYAIQVCPALIDYSLENNYEPYGHVALKI